MSAIEILRPYGRPGALPFRFERKQVRATSDGMTPRDFDRAGAGREHTEQSRKRTDGRAETTRRLEDVERLGCEDVTELKKFRRREHHAYRRGGRIDVGRMEAEDVAVGAEARDHEVAVIAVVAADVVGVVRRLDPAAGVAQELEDGLLRFAEDFSEVRRQFETFGARHADGTQLPALHVDDTPPVIEGPDDADGAVRGLRTEGFPQEEMDAVALDPMP